MMKPVKLGDREVPVLGQSTWRLGEDRRARAEERQPYAMGSHGA